MIQPIFGILLSISIINGGIITQPTLDTLQLPDTSFTQQTTLISQQPAMESEFSYFVDVQLPKIKERTQQEQERIASLDLAAEKAKQEEIVRILDEQERIAAEVAEMQRQQEEAARLKAEQDAIQRRKAQEEATRKQAEARAAIAIPANTDYVSLIRARCAQLGCNSDQIIRVMYCESGGRANAYNSRYEPHGPGSGPSGLFQHVATYWPGRASRYGVAGASIWDPNAQIIVTTAMFAEGQAKQWECK